MSFLDPYDTIRLVESPITSDQLKPLGPNCRVVQFCTKLTDQDHIRLAEFMRGYPETPLRIYGHGPTGISFLKHYPTLTHLQVDIYRLESMDGMEHLPENLKSFTLTQTATKKISLRILERFTRLKRLHLESHSKDIQVLSKLTSLEQLTLRSITLPDLSILVPLKKLWPLDLKLGGTGDLALLPEIGNLKYLELWMIRGLDDLGVIGKIRTLQNLFLQALKNVTALPSFRDLVLLRKVALDTMKGLTDLSPIAEAPALEELIVVHCNQFKPADFSAFKGHPKLKAATIDLGSLAKNARVEKILGISGHAGNKSNFIYN